MNKERVLELSQKGIIYNTPDSFIKDPMVVEFVCLPEEKPMLESDLEKALIEHIEDFLLELGRGFMFVGSQQRISIAGMNYYVDMVFYNKILRAYVLIDLKINIYNEIYKLYDPCNILDSFKISKLPFTNLEYAKKIDEFSTLLFDLYRSILCNDKLLSYNIALKIQNVFILIYRGFYDSLNSKKEYAAINKTMDEKYYLNLINKIKYFRYDNFFDYIREYIKEVNGIIDKLPINIITLFNIDFYTYTKKLIYEL